MEKTIFLGDSITQGFQQLRKHKEIINLGISGDRTHDVIKRLDIVKKLNPTKLFLMIGINDVMNNHHLWFNDFPIDIKRTYHYIVNYLVDQLELKELYVLSVLPVSSDGLIDLETTIKINQEIQELNQFIESLSKGYMINYIDLYHDFILDGELDSSLTTDGVHLSEKGYQKFYKKIFILLNKIE